jgi:hypothetical protein
MKGWLNVIQCDYKNWVMSRKIGAAGIAAWSFGNSIVSGVWGQNPIDLGRAEIFWKRQRFWHIKNLRDACGWNMCFLTLSWHQLFPMSLQLGSCMSA